MQTLEQQPQHAAAPMGAPAPPPDMKAANPFVRWLLRSPLHGMLSRTLLLLTYTGRKSGKQYTIPVAYSRVGDSINIFTRHTWWKQVRGGTPVVVEIQRQRFAGVAEAISDDPAVIGAALLAHLREHPAMARSYHIPRDTNRQPDPEAVQQVAHFEVLVRIQLVPTSCV